MQKSTINLDIGCGSNPRNPYSAQILVGLDIDFGKYTNKDGVKLITHDFIASPLPFPDSSFTYVSAYDVLEHIPRIIYTPERKLPFVQIMNEISRILKPGGKFYSSTPYYPHKEAFMDPTHVNFVTAETFTHYFDSRNNWAGSYGYEGCLNVISMAAASFHLIVEMVKSN